MDPRIKLALCASAAVWMGTGAAIVFEISFKPELKRLFGNSQKDQHKQDKEQEKEKSEQEGKNQEDKKEID